MSCDQNFFYFLIFLATYFIFQYFTPPAVSFHSFCRKFYLFFLQPDILDAHDMLRFNISGKKIVDKFISLLVKSVLKLSLLPSRTSRNSIVLTWSLRANWLWLRYQLNSVTPKPWYSQVQSQITGKSWKLGGFIFKVFFRHNCLISRTIVR